MQSFYKLPLTATILAGGKSIRMGIPKCLIKINEYRIIEKLLIKISKFFDEIFIVTNFPESYYYLKFSLLGDIYKFKGPMAGIHVALKNSTYDVFAFACDMPFIDEKIIGILAESHIKNSNYATVAEFREKIYPLPGIYSKKVLNYLEDLIKQDKLSMTKLLSDIKAQIIDVANLNKEGLSFININTQEELQNLLKGGVRCLD